MNSELLNEGLGSIEAAYSTSGDAIDSSELGSPIVVPGSDRASSVGEVKCRSYIKYPASEGLKAHASNAFHVADLCAAYKFPTNLAGGGTIGILELGGGYRQSDLDLFSQINGLPQIVPNDVSVNGGQNTPGGDADGEVLLDIQVAAAAYYYCVGEIPNINVYFAPMDDASFVAVINAAVADGCDVLSISWGKDEKGWDPTVLDQVEAAAAAAAESGCIIFAASGDNSSGDGAPGANVDAPAACPHILGCGGTKKTASGEVVWGDGTPNGQGSGGGYSSHFPRPTWQIGVQSNHPHRGRIVPDVAADADPNTGYLVVVNGQEAQIGGTSAVAPLYAGLFASFGQQLGFVTPTLYQNPSAFFDIASGSNGSFHASHGVDPCTGLGVPNGTALSQLFANLS